MLPHPPRSLGGSAKEASATPLPGVLEAQQRKLLPHPPQKSRRLSKGGCCHTPQEFWRLSKGSCCQTLPQEYWRLSKDSCCDTLPRVSEAQQRKLLIGPGRLLPPWLVWLLGPGRCLPLWLVWLLGPGTSVAGLAARAGLLNISVAVLAAAATEHGKKEKKKVNRQRRTTFLFACSALSDDFECVSLLWQNPPAWVSQ